MLKELEEIEAHFTHRNRERNHTLNEHFKPKDSTGLVWENQAGSTWKIN